MPAADQIFATPSIENALMALWKYYSNNGNGPVITALNAATGTGDSAIFDLGAVKQNWTMQTVVTGTPASVSITLRTSLDGTNFTIQATSTSTSGDQQNATSKPARFVKVNLGTLTGGTSPTVTALIAGF